MNIPMRITKTPVAMRDLEVNRFNFKKYWTHHRFLKIKPR